MSGRWLEESVFDMPVGKHQNGKRTIRGEADKLDMFEGRFVFGRQNQAGAMRHAGKRRADTVEDASDIGIAVAQAAFDGIAVGIVRIADFKDTVDEKP